MLKDWDKLETWIKRAPDMKVRYLSYLNKEEDHGVFKFRWDTYLRMHIELTDKGWEYLNEEYDIHGTHDNPYYKGTDGVWGLWVDAPRTHGHPLVNAMYDMMESIICNSEWEYQMWDTEIPYMHTCGIAGDGQLDVEPGDITWDYNSYAINLILEDIILSGEAVLYPTVCAYRRASDGKKYPTWRPV